MLESVIVGAGLGFTAGAQPGPLQAYLFSRVAAIGWRRTLPASFAPLVSDGPIAILALLILGRMSPGLQSALRAAGGLLLLSFSWRAVVQWRRNAPAAVAPAGKVPRTLLEAALVNLLNPNPYIGWALVLGPVVVDAWNRDPGSGVAVVVAFYAMLVIMLAVVIFAFGTARFLGPRLQRSLLLASAVILAGLGVYQLIVAGSHFRG